MNKCKWECSSRKNATAKLSLQSHSQSLSPSLSLSFPPAPYSHRPLVYRSVSVCPLPEIFHQSRADITVVSLSSFSCLPPVPCALAHSSQADLRGGITVQEMKLFHSSPLLLSSRSWWGPLLLQRHVGRDVSCVRSSSLLTCVWPFVPAAEGAAAFSIKWLVIWGSRGVELSSVYAQFSAISERLMFAWAVTHTMEQGILIFSGWAF